jgi:hypothetical protein
VAYRASEEVRTSEVRVTQLGVEDETRTNSGQRDGRRRARLGRRPRRGWNDFDRGDFNRGPGHWDKGPWWANNRHDWWDDRQGPPPWGWGPPPAYQWTGGPPRPFNYWGYDVNPVWDDGFHQWGIWLFGLWIPIIGIGVG